MWLGVLVILIAVVAAVAGAFAGGVFTIVLIPIAAIGAFIAVGLILVARASKQPGRRARGEAAVDKGNELPRNFTHAPSHVPTSPGGLADMRREQQ